VMYWGNPGAADSSSGTAVFDTANGFVGVWHLGETGNTDPQGYKDATFNAYDGTGFQLTGADAPAVIGNGQTFAGTATPNGTGNQGLGCYIKVSDGVINVASGSISLWAQITTLPVTPANADAFGSWNTNNARYYFGCDATGQLRGGYGPNKQFVTASYKLTPGTFYHLVMAWSGNPTKATMYVNDTLRGTSAAQAVAAPSDINIGSFGAGYSDPWIGPLDECRVENVQRSADWLKLCYESQKPGSAWLGLQATSAQLTPAQSRSNSFGLQAVSSMRSAGITTIRYSLPEDAKVNLAVYNLRGGLVRTLVNAETNCAGAHAILWSGRDDFNRTVANGSYICTITTSGFAKSSAIAVTR
jgi:Concanavalin A-like lectin/glucanases superfamily/FlgD Ig-like domain